jgi:hypothetical protein
MVLLVLVVLLVVVVLLLLLPPDTGRSPSWQASADVAERERDATNKDTSGGNAQHFAHINSAVGVGLAIGSFVGGQLTYVQAAGLAGGVNALTAAMVIVGLPVLRGNPSSSSAKGEPSAGLEPRRGRSRSLFPSPRGQVAAKGAAEAAVLPLGVLVVMVTMRLLFSSCATAQRETFALAVKARMNMSEGWIGAFLSYKGTYSCVSPLNLPLIVM